MAHRLAVSIFLACSTCSICSVFSIGLLPVQDDPDLSVIVELLAEIDDADLQKEFLSGLSEGLRGRSKLTMPEAWPAAYAKLSKSESAEVRDQALAIALIFDDPKALRALRETLTRVEASKASRVRALEALVGKRVKDLPETLFELLDEASMRGHALRALAAYKAKDTPKRILAIYPKLNALEKPDALTTLSSRPSYALALLHAVEKKSVPRRDVLAIHARQMDRLGDRAVSELIAEVWGVVRRSSAEKKAAIAAMKKRLRPDVLAKADLSNGRLLFQNSCAKCHKLYGEGADLAPELTGSNRANLDYIVETILDPNAAIGKDYRLHIAVTKTGRVVSGLLAERSGGRITLRTENESVTLLETDLIDFQESESSMMPEGLLETLSGDEVRDLIAYLGTKAQVPLPKMPKIGKL